MKHIGRYIIRGLLGRGGMGKVFKVELPAIGKIAALKRFDPVELLAKVMGRQRLRDLFVQEAVTMASLRHPHVVALHDFDEINGAPFYVMDYFADDLGALIGEHYEIERPTRVLTIDRALSYIRQTLDGLACLHDAGIVHRDIKPFNLLLTPNDCIQICDFGLSKLRGESFGGPSNLNVGSPYYAAPEQENHADRAEATADLYPVGIMLYRMLTGRLPSAGSRSEPYLPPSHLNPDLDDHWDAWMVQAIAVHPEDRFPTANDMGRALEALADHWAIQKGRACSLPLDSKVLPVRTRLSTSLRSIPLKALPQRASGLFKVDSLWRPKVYMANDFEPGSQGAALEKILVDRATGLAWQQSGSAFPRTWPEAKAHIDRLNQKQFAGRTDWRLPTIDELLSLLRPPPTVNDLCIAPLFDTIQRRLWSADRRSYVAAYYVDIELGFVGWQDFSASFYVRGVCPAL